MLLLTSITIVKSWPTLRETEAPLPHIGPAAANAKSAIAAIQAIRPSFEGVPDRPNSIDSIDRERTPRRDRRQSGGIINKRTKK
jgi:hypothetical protein